MKNEAMKFNNVTELQARRAEKAREQGTVEIYAVGPEGLKTMFLNTIRAKLGVHADALKLFDVRVFVPENEEQKQALARLNNGCFIVEGAMGLNDSGENWRAFGVNIEGGMSEKADQEVANQMAHQCLICLHQMRRELAQKGMVCVATG